MQFLADENIEAPIVAALRAAGYEVLYIAFESTDISENDPTVWAAINRDVYGSDAPKSKDENVSVIVAQNFRPGRSPGPIQKPKFQNSESRTAF